MRHSALATTAVALACDGTTPQFALAQATSTTIIEKEVETFTVTSSRGRPRMDVEMQVPNNAFDVYPNKWNNCAESAKGQVISHSTGQTPDTRNSGQLGSNGSFYFVT